MGTPQPRGLFMLAPMSSLNCTTYILIFQFRKIDCVVGICSDWNSDFFCPQLPSRHRACNCNLAFLVETMLRFTQVARPLADHWMASLSFLFLQDFCMVFTALVRVLSSLLPVSVLRTRKYSQGAHQSPVPAEVGFQTQESPG